MTYLDNNATTRLYKSVFHKQCEVLNRYFGNPSALYPIGVEVKAMIEKARRQVASLINADLDGGDRILFTSCATESNNAVVHSAMYPFYARKHMVISAVEHPAISATADYYQRLGNKVTRVNVSSDGNLQIDELRSAINDKTALVSIMYVNSETGVIHDISSVVQLVKEQRKDVIVHTDAVQAAGKIPIDVQALGVDMLTLSGHKFHAPKGIGILYIKKGISFTPFLCGGHQENNMRAGTENTAAIVAIGEAAAAAKMEIELGVPERIRQLRDTMEGMLKAHYPDSMIFGEHVARVCNTTNIGFKNILGYKLVLQLAQRGIYVSSGTACNSVNAKPSSVLTAMNAPKEYVSSIRISLDSHNTEEDISNLLAALDDIMGRRN